MAMLKGKHPQLEAILIDVRSVCPQNLKLYNCCWKSRCIAVWKNWDRLGICGGVAGLYLQSAIKTIISDYSSVECQISCIPPAGLVLDGAGYTVPKFSLQLVSVPQTGLGKYYINS